jgi:hypothetical protein
MKYAIGMSSDAKFHKDWFRHSEVNGGGTHRDTDTMEIA